MLIEICRSSDFALDIGGIERSSMSFFGARLTRHPDALGVRRWYIRLERLDDLADLVRLIGLPVEIDVPYDDLFDLRLVILCD